MSSNANSPSPAKATVVYLVGAGPGDPGLLTCAGADALRRADVCVYDYLANAKLLELLSPSCERIYVGKSAGQHTLTQEQINALLVDTARKVDAARAGRTGRGGVVVRLKGGDPFIFGRGGEEGQALYDAQIPFVVIPGVTSGIAGPAYAGIPATHRNIATTLTLVTGHESDEKGGGVPTLDVPTLASLIAAGGTVVFYMGVRNLPNIAEQFTKCLQARSPAATAPIPAAVIGWATHPHQRTIVGDLSNIAERVEKAGIKPPAIILLGQVVTLREKLNWFENRPLFGQRVLVTRTRQQASELANGLTALGAEVLEAPTIELADPEDWSPIDAALRHLAAYDWLVFTSANGVRAAWDRLRNLDLDVRAFCGIGTGIAAIGPATAEALAQIGIIADMVPDDFVGEALAAALLVEMRKSTRHPGTGIQRALLLRADIARPALREDLQQAGIVVDDLPIYRTVRPATLPEDILQTIQEGQFDWVTFTSASTAANLHALLSDELRAKVAGAKRLSIGPQTTATLTKLGWAPTIETPRHDIPGMIAALTTAVANK